MKGYSTQEPEPIERHGDGYQFRYNIEPVERVTDAGTVAEYQYDYIDMPMGAVGDDLERCYFKAVRAAKMESLTVTTSSGKVFDADEVSQTRMTRALQTSGFAGQTQTPWVLADNSVANVTADEMREALALAMQAQAALWFA
jgi:hypothetical protein